MANSNNKGSIYCNECGKNVTSKLHTEVDGKHYCLDCSEELEIDFDEDELLEEGAGKGKKKRDDFKEPYGGMGSFILVMTFLFSIGVLVATESIILFLLNMFFGIAFSMVFFAFSNITHSIYDLDKKVDRLLDDKEEK